MECEGGERVRTHYHNELTNVKNIDTTAVTTCPGSCNAMKRDKYSHTLPHEPPEALLLTLQPTLIATQGIRVREVVIESTGQLGDDTVLTVVHFYAWNNDQPSNADIYRPQETGVDHRIHSAYIVRYVKTG